MDRRQDNNVIRLRFVILKDGNRYKSICLDTNIAARASSLGQLEQKNIDASVLYLRSFNEQEIHDKSFIRKASLKYFILWYWGIIIHKINKKTKSRTAQFNYPSGKMSFA